MISAGLLIKNASVAPVLDKLGIQYERRSKHDASELYFTCINKGHDTPTKKMSIQEAGPKKGLFYCWSCGMKGNLIQFIMMVRNCSFFEAIRWLKEYSISDVANSDILKYNLSVWKGLGEDGITDSVVCKLPDDYTLCYNGGATGDAERFLQERQIAPEISKAFEVGVGTHEKIGRALVIPIWFDGDLRSVYYSELRSGGRKRYPAGAPQGRILFNYSRCVEEGRYILVESIMDVLRLESLGYSAMACFSNMITDTQLDLLKKFDLHRVFPDMDSPRGWDLVTRMLPMTGKDLWLILPPLGKDPGDCTDMEIHAALLTMRRYCDWEVDRAFGKTQQEMITEVLKR